MIGVFEEFGVFDDGGVLEGGVFQSLTDPLAGIDFLLRLQTHRGDNVPFGLYQDTACTIPATSAGHPIGAWRDEFSGVTVYTQSDNTKRMVLSFISGVPVVTKTSDDDFLTSPLATPDSLQFIIGARLVSPVVFFRVNKFDLAATGVLQLSDTGVQAITSYSWEEASNGHRVHSAKLTKSGANISGTMFLDGTSMASGTVVQSALDGDSAIAAANSAGAIAGYADYTSIYVISSLDDSTRQIIESYAATLRP